jgi:hypothetical protein
MKKGNVEYFDYLETPGVKAKIAYVHKMKKAP